MSFEMGCRSLALTAFLVLSVAAQAQQADVGARPAANSAQRTEAERVPDPARGEKLFRACRKCHEITPGQVKIGPSLAGIVGRRPGSVSAFGYSQDMIDLGGSGAVWDRSSLDRFLTRPRAMIAGTKMVFQGFRKPVDRADLIAYLSTIRG